MMGVSVDTLLWLLGYCDGSVGYGKPSCSVTAPTEAQHDTAAEFHAMPFMADIQQHRSRRQPAAASMGAQVTRVCVASGSSAEGGLMMLWQLLLLLCSIGSMHRRQGVSQHLNPRELQSSSCACIAK